MPMFAVPMLAVHTPGKDVVLTCSLFAHAKCRIANWLRKQGVRKGDCVSLYMGMVSGCPAYTV